jgi:hypothetical protein
VLQGPEDEAPVEWPDLNAAVAETALNMPLPASREAKGQADQYGGGFGGNRRSGWFGSSKLPWHCPPNDLRIILLQGFSKICRPAKAAR